MKILKPFSTIVLMENDELVSEDRAVANILNEYFSNVAKSLNIADNNENLLPVDGISDPVTAAIAKYRSHPSVLLIKSHCEDVEAFSFRRATFVEVFKQVDNLNIKKASPISSIPAKIIKDNVDEVASHLLDLFNVSVDENFFPNELKDGDVSALFKNSDSFHKKNYRPITVLPSVSKVFERLLVNQMLPFVNKFLSPSLCAYRQGYNTQHALPKLVETCKKTLDNRGFVGAVLMDLSKAFDCLNHELLLAKLNAYGFSKNAIKMVHSYLAGRRQRVKINGSFSSWKEMKLGVPQGSVLGPLLFNIFINDIFLLLNETEICNYADDTTIYCSHKELQEVILKLENDTVELSNWLAQNCMKLNEEKCHLLVFGEKETEISIKVGTSVIKESKEERLLGVVIDQKLNFKQHVDMVCTKASQKLHALARASTYMPKEKTRTVVRAFVMSQFSYCPLIWMFHDRRVNAKINHIHERALRIAYHDRTSSFEELLITDHSVSIHQRNLQLLVTEIYRTRMNLNPCFMKEIFAEREILYNFRVTSNIYARRPRTTAYGLETVSFLGQNLWRDLPLHIKESRSVQYFKKEIKFWNFSCNCRLCKDFIVNLGYI